MKKIAIVSCYFKHNYGSMLQAYATQLMLEKIGYENETIDISMISRQINQAKIKYFIKAALSSGILAVKFGMAKNVIYRKFGRAEYVKNIKIRSNKFEGFMDEYFNLSEVYSSKNILSEVCGNRYQAVVVGSDQLWSPANIAADYHTLNFVPNGINTIAYATSFGQSYLPRYVEKRARVFLSKIRHLSVREYSGQKLIKQFVNRKIPVVCDPTLLFSGEEWLHVQKVEPIVSGQYILCYFLGSNVVQREFAIRLRRKTGVKIIVLPHLDEYIKYDENYADEMRYDVGPSEFLNLIRHASYICTDSFHGSVYSILYKKRFFAFRRYKQNSKYSTNSRLDTLFELTGLKACLLNGDEEINDCLSLDMNYMEVHEKIEKVRRDSLCYLKDALENKETDIC